MSDECLLWSYFFMLCVCVWLQAAAGRMTGCASASLLTAREPSERHCHPFAPSRSLSLSCSPPLSPALYLSVFCSLPPPRPLESADGTFFCRKEKILTHTHRGSGCVEGGVVDKGKNVLLFYIRDAFVWWGLTRLTGCQSPLFLPTRLPFYSI